MSNEKRRAPENGLWLCQNCARLIDVDPAAYPVSLLNQWRIQSDEWARSRIGRRQVEASEPVKNAGFSHLYIEHRSNYTDLYLDDVTVPVSNISDCLSFQNIDNRAITHMRATVFAFKEFNAPDLFTHFYDINTEHYISLGSIDIGALNGAGTYVLRLGQVYELACATLRQSQSALSNLLFPRIGERIQYGVRVANAKAGQAFTTNEKLLKTYFHLKPQDRSNAVGGLPIKIVLDYRHADVQYSSLFYGGTYYFAHFDGEYFTPLEQAVGFFVKPRYSLARSRSHLPQVVIDVETEIHYRGDEMQARAPDPNRISLHFAYEPDDGTGLERLLAVDVDRNLPQRFGIEGHAALQRSDFQTADRLLTRCLSLRPGDQSALINRGVARHNLGFTAQAVVDFQLAADLGNDAGLEYAKSIGLVAVT